MQKKLLLHKHVMSSEVENGAAGEAATWTGRPKAERTGSELIKSRRFTVVWVCGIPRLRFAPLGMTTVRRNYFCSQQSQYRRINSRSVNKKRAELRPHDRRTREAIDP